MLAVLSLIVWEMRLSAMKAPQASSLASARTRNNQPSGGAFDFSGGPDSQQNTGHMRIH
jgi:hypothetical protein